MGELGLSLTPMRTCYFCLISVVYSYCFEMSKALFLSYVYIVCPLFLGAQDAIYIPDHCLRRYFFHYMAFMVSDKATLKICSWNVRGIHNPIKRKKSLSVLKKEHVHIAMLQETDLSINEHSKLKCDWVGQVVSSLFMSKSRGVAIFRQTPAPV